MLSADTRKALMVDGATVVKSYVSPAQLEIIDAEIAPWLRQVAWNDIPGYALRANDQ